MTLNRYLEHDRGTKGVLSLSPRENTSLPVRNDWSNWRSFHVEAEVEKNRNLGRNQRNFSKKFDQISTDLSRSRRNGMRSLYFPCIVKNNPSNEKSTRFKWVLQKSIKWTRLFEKPIKCYSHTLQLIVFWNEFFHLIDFWNMPLHLIGFSLEVLRND